MSCSVCLEPISHKINLLCAVADDAIICLYCLYTYNQCNDCTKTDVTYNQYFANYTKHYESYHSVMNQIRRLSSRKPPVCFDLLFPSIYQRLRIERVAIENELVERLFG